MTNSLTVDEGSQKLFSVIWGRRFQTEARFVYIASQSYLEFYLLLKTQQPQSTVKVLCQLLKDEVRGEG